MALVDQQILKMADFMSTSIRDIKFERKATLDNNNAQFKNIKEVCCDFFQRYDHELDEQKAENALMREKYKNWSSSLIEPTALNVSKLFALESRVLQEENIRLQEMRFI